MSPSNARRVVGLLALALPALMIGNANPVLAQAKKSDSVVKATAKAAKPDANGNQAVTITLDIAKSWHTYAHPVGNEDLANAETTVLINAKVKPENVKIEYPAGKVVVDSMLGNYKVYQDKVTIKATVKRAKGDSSPLEISIKVQACNEVKKQCYLPATIKVTVP
ncbi:MAG TPA: protein-disulfide reductase DsbD N-terminal domain-containing protein [Gemmataceae bacterium]|nr:protein-disulfide reductase DsbD N-terminal domain-containing protein [Gemmataceae bacterium]